MTTRRPWRKSKRDCCAERRRNTDATRTCTRPKFIKQSNMLAKHERIPLEGAELMEGLHRDGPASRLTASSRSPERRAPVPVGIGQMRSGTAGRRASRRRSPARVPGCAALRVPAQRSAPYGRYRHSGCRRALSADRRGSINRCRASSWRRRAARASSFGTPQEAARSLQRTAAALGDGTTAFSRK